MRILKVAIVAVVLGQAACTKHADPLKDALSSGQWGGVLGEAGAERAREVAGILRGHTLLLGNRNGEAVCDFVKQDAVALNEYRTTAQRLSKLYPDSAVADYLVGDALARSSRWPEAIASFGRALAIDKRFALALVARGVALVSSGELQDGKRDLYSALMSDPKLAEAQAAMGWTLLKEGQPATTARNYFATAVKLSPGYSLAAAGKGLAEVAAGDAEKGADEVAGQLRAGNCVAALLVSNSLMAASWIRSGGTAGPEDAPGTEINVTAQNADKLFKLVAQGNRAAFNQAVAVIGANPILEPKMKVAIMTLAKNDPATWGAWQRQLPRDYNFTGPGAGAHKIIDAASVILPMAAEGIKLAIVRRAPTAAPIVSVPLAGAVAAGEKALGAQWQSTINAHEGQGWLLRTLPAYTPPKAPVGGATTNLDNARLDKGKWPFEPVFGLLYPKS
jgi:tetratricopeptide (TPR) repeat protein